MFIRVNPLKILPLYITLFLSCVSLKAEIPPGPFSELNLSPDEVKNFLIERDKGFHGLKAMGRFIIVKKEDLSQSFDGIFFFEKPSKLRLQGMSMGNVIFDVIFKDDKLYLYQTLDRQISIIENDDFRYLSLLFTEISEESSILIEKENEGYVVYYKEKDGKLIKKTWLDRGYLLPIREEVFDSEGAKRLGMAFSDLRSIEGRWYSHRIEAIEIKKGFKLIIDFKKIIINPDFVKRDFEFPSQQKNY